MTDKKKVQKVAKDTRWIWKNLLLGVAFVFVLGFLAAWCLGVITRHGKVVTTPDFANLTVPQAQELASRSHVSVKVVDSVFVRRLAGGVVYRQQPKAGATVKKGRSIFLTINSVVPRKVVMPNLFGYSVTEARSELRNRGLNLGRLNYIKDIATNNVLGQSCEGLEVAAGDLVVSGSVIDLIVGVGDQDNQTTVPKLTGMKYVNAVDAIQERFLNVGKITFDPDIKTYADSMNAVVYKQDPAGAGRSLGANVNFALTLDLTKLPANK
jgi:beta-lactam-binding protein with PASTA domain